MLGPKVLAGLHRILNLKGPLMVVGRSWVKFLGGGLLFLRLAGVVWIPARVTQAERSGTVRGCMMSGSSR